MKRIGKWVAWLTLMVILALGAAWAISPDPKFNPATFEDEPLVAGVAPLSEAVTLAQFTEEGGEVRTLLVLTFTDESVTGVDLQTFGAAASADPFDALASAKGLPASGAEARGLPTVLSV